MAGGLFAEEVPCMECLGENRVTKAVRVHEGVESDQYRCELGHEFCMDFRKGPPAQPQWPLPPETIAAITGN